MTLEAAFKDLVANWQRLAEELEQGLLWSVAEAKPAEEHALATDCVDGATDLAAAAREGLAVGRAAADPGAGLGRAARALLGCQERYNTLTEQFYSRMASSGRLRRLRRFGREKGGAWRDWATHVRQALGRCRRPLDDLNRSLLTCWQEVIDRLVLGGVSVQTTSIGQQITLPAEGGAQVASVT
jgi:hypothetical protein